ncbi:hypothetical protein Tco_1475763 [Tanacetum coccineum]
MLESNAYKTYYAFASREKAQKPKYVRKKFDLDTLPKQNPVQANKGTRLKSKAKVAKHDKKKQHAKKTKSKGLTILSEVALTEGDGVDTQSKVPDEQQKKSSGTDEGTGSIPGVPDVPIYESKSDKDNDGNNGDDDANDDDKQEGDDTNNDDEETDSDRNDEVTKELYEDVNVNLGNEDTEMTNADQGASEQQNKADEPVQSSSVSSDFTSKLLNLENPSPTNNEIASLMETLACHATTVPEITSGFTTTIPPPPSFFNPLLQHATPAPTPTTSEATTLFPLLLDFTSVFKFNERVTNLEKDLLKIKQVDQYAQALSSIPAIVDRYMDNKLGEAINKAIQPHNFDSISDVATPIIEKNVTESVEAAILSRSSSQPTFTYKAAASLPEFKLTKILIDKMEKNKSYDKADYKKKLYDALVESYNTDKDLFDAYGEVFSLKRSRDERDKYRDSSAGSDRGMKRRKSSKDAESSRDSRSKEKKSLSTSKDASQSRHKSSGKSAHAEEPSHTVEDSSMQQDQEYVTGDNDEQPAGKEVTKADWFKKPERPPTSDPDWKPPTLFDELNDASFDFSAFVMNRLKISNLTQEILVGPAFNLLKGTCKSIMELEYHPSTIFKECSKAIIERLDWHNPENKPYPFDLRKPLPLIQDHQGGQIIPKDYFINKDLEFEGWRLKQGRYLTFYDQSKGSLLNESNGLNYLGSELWNPLKLKYDNMLNWALYTSGPTCIKLLWIMQLMICLKDGLLKRRIYCDIKDMLLLLVQQKLTNLTINKRPHGIIYVDQYKRKTLMRADELHKFNDGTLNDVQSALHDIAAGIRMEYLPIRKWSNLDKKRAWVMVQDIDKQLYQRRLMRNLEKFVGGRVYGNDLSLLERTI